NPALGYQRHGTVMCVLGPLLPWLRCLAAPDAVPSSSSPWQWVLPSFPRLVVLPEAHSLPCGWLMVPLVLQLSIKAIYSAKYDCMLISPIDSDAFYYDARVHELST